MYHQDFAEKKTKTCDKFFAPQDVILHGNK